MNIFSSRLLSFPDIDSLQLVPEDTVDPAILPTTNLMCMSMTVNKVLQTIEHGLLSYPAEQGIWISYRFLLLLVC